MAQYKKLRDYTVIEVEEGDIGRGSKEDAKKFIESCPDGEDLTERKKQVFLIEKCSIVDGLFDALYEEANLKVINGDKETYVVS